MLPFYSDQEMNPCTDREDRFITTTARLQMLNLVWGKISRADKEVFEMYFNWVLGWVTLAHIHVVQLWQCKKIYL